jgi:hypothetical protein
MNNIVTEIDTLKLRIDLELELRSATDIEMRNGVENGPMMEAHNTSIQQVVEAARELIAKFDS